MLNFLYALFTNIDSKFYITHRGETQSPKILLWFHKPSCIGVNRNVPTAYNWKKRTYCNVVEPMIFGAWEGMGTELSVSCSYVGVMGIVIAHEVAMCMWQLYFIFCVVMGWWVWLFLFHSAHTHFICTYTVQYMCELSDQSIIPLLRRLTGYEPQYKARY